MPSGCSGGNLRTFCPGWHNGIGISPDLHGIEPNLIWQAALCRNGHKALARDYYLNRMWKAVEQSSEQ